MASLNPIPLEMKPRDLREKHAATPFVPFVYVKKKPSAFKALVHEEKSRRHERKRQRKQLRKSARTKFKNLSKVKPAPFKVDETDHTALRSMPYKDYLKTDHWKDVRRRLFQARGRKCEKCKRGKSVSLQIDVHHLTYERRGQELLTDLQVLCRDCHNREHAGS